MPEWFGCAGYPPLPIRFNKAGQVVQSADLSRSSKLRCARVAGIDPPSSTGTTVFCAASSWRPVEIESRPKIPGHDRANLSGPRHAGVLAESLQFSPERSWQGNALAFAPDGSFHFKRIGGEHARCALSRRRCLRFRRRSASVWRRNSVRGRNAATSIASITAGLPGWYSDDEDGTLPPRRLATSSMSRTRLEPLCPPKAKGRHRRSSRQDRPWGGRRGPARRRGAAVRCGPAPSRPAPRERRRSKNQPPAARVQAGPADSRRADWCRAPAHVRRAGRRTRRDPLLTRKISAAKPAEEMRSA